MKYWSCCRRKTSDFNTFLAQEGCTTGKHMWTKKDAVSNVLKIAYWGVFIWVILKTFEITLSLDLRGKKVPHSKVWWT